uniref:H-2 class II histocompatibility antigen, I-A beta chain-like n=1 Tax=Seriola dumerili TaxID=41447 RepID=A0A3B4U0X1_SERDU
LNKSVLGNSLTVVCSSDGFMDYDVSRCDFNFSEPNDITYIYSMFYNKLGKFVGYTEIGVKNAERLNKGPEVVQRRNDCCCSSHLLIIMCVPVEPYVVMSSTTPPAGKHPAMLVCSVFDFYPKQIRVSWHRDGQEVSSDELTDGDWFYQVHSHLEYTPRSGEKISCVVEHASLKEPLVTDWDPSMPESERNKIAIGASGLILGLILSLAGFIYYRRKARGQKPVYTSLFVWKTSLHQFTV